MPLLTEEGAPTCINLLGRKIEPVCTLGAHREPRVHDVPQSNTEGTALNPITPSATRETSGTETKMYVALLRVKADSGEVQTIGWLGVIPRALPIGGHLG